MKILSFPTQRPQVVNWTLKPSTWHPADRGLPGITVECEEVLQILLSWAWKHPHRWVSAAIRSRPIVCGGAYMTEAELDEHWLPHIEFLIGLGRITAKTIDGKKGWIVPSAKEWRQLHGNPRRA
jgi:hypothetical protein